MPEGAPTSTPQEKVKKSSSVLEAGVVAAALLSMPCGEEAKALEMDPYTPWVIGIQDNVRQGVETDSVEHATTYVQFSDGSGAWTTVTKGNEMSVKINLNEEKEELAHERRHREIVNICRLHLHEAALYKKFLGLEVRPHNPPSDVDIASTRNAKTYYQGVGLPPEKVVNAVADVRGIWYFGPLSDAELQKYPTAFVQTIAVADPNRTIQKDWYKEFSHFVMESVKPTFNFGREFPKLRHAYQAYLGGDIRFVPYENIDKEPVCAGVDYADTKK